MTLFIEVPDKNAMAPVYKTSETLPDFSYAVNPDPVLLFRYSADVQWPSHTLRSAVLR